ncbi:VOC family protein [Duganella qianjiadongensis]|uniref:Glyoxalase n=1 Tax=Duganella qianjiadongensis TaxID=2692176 RepID=A0ABW9VS11_9BURK|nr:VOC family protein [Duganella qianjiadongensis]MYM41408.1 glyoxalase [Duganella qianjiadongensis]
MPAPAVHTSPSGLPPSQRLHLILLGVADVAAAVGFYQALGWQPSPSSNEGFAKFDLGGYAMCLLSRSAFAADALSPTATGSGFAGIGLVYLARSAEEVAQVLERAVHAGGTLVKPATRTDWGVAGYFKDPDGHLFEVDYEDGWVLDHDHRLQLDGIQP